MNITKLFGCITEISLRASGIAAGVLAIRLLVRKMPGKYGCILWMTAFFAFLIPASVRITCTIPMKAQSGMSAGQAERLRMGIPAEMRYAAQKDKNPNEGHAEYHAVPGRISAESTDVYRRILAAVWAAGIVIFLIWQTYRYWHLKRILSVAVRKSGNVYVSDKVDSPFLMGLLAPNIYLPANMDEKTAYFAVLHEQMHQQRKDYLVKFAVFLICACYWWNEYASLADTVQEEGSSADISDKSHLPEEFWEDRIREYTGFPEYYVYRDYNPYEKEQKKGLLFIRVFGTYNWYMSKDFMKVWKKPVTEIAGQIIEQFEEIKEVRVCWDETIGKKGRSGAGVKPVGIIQMAKYK